MNPGERGASGFAPGWYPDGHGVLRYHDGSQWTGHTHRLVGPGDGVPVLVPAPPPLEQGAALAAVGAPPPPPAGGANTDTAGATEGVAQPLSWLLAVAAVVAVVMLFGAVAFVLGGTEPGAGSAPVAATTATTGLTATAPSPQGSPSATSFGFGVTPAAIAAAIGCGELREQKRSPERAAVHFASATCTYQGAELGIYTYPTAVDQSAAEAALGDFIGAGRYASGQGWLALDEDYLLSIAQQLADRLGGTVKARPTPSATPTTSSSATSTPSATATPGATPRSTSTTGPSPSTSPRG